ncbi:hypothetical protein GCM10027610_088290 [Dactylosporangium cerinum]
MGLLAVPLAGLPVGLLMVPLPALLAIPPVGLLAVPLAGLPVGLLAGLLAVPRRAYPWGC